MSLRNPVINQHSSINQILQYCHFNTCILIDIDDTIATQELGDPWFVKLMEEACRKAPGKETCELIIAIYHAVQRVTQMQIIEKETAILIKALQDIHIPVIALTSRGIPIIKSTLNQLNEIDIHFDRQWENQEITLMIDGKAHLTQFQNGIIFCTGNDKGKCLSAFFKTTNYFPEHVVMIDDKESHLKSVHKVIDSYGGTFEGIRYNHMDGKNKLFDFNRAQQQLELLKIHFPEKDQAAVNTINKILQSKDSFFKPVEKDQLESKDMPGCKVKLS